MSLLKGDIVVAERQKRMKREAEQRELERVRQKQRKKVSAFLKRNEFEALKSKDSGRV